MADKIERLTPEQEAELPAFRQKYLDRACNGARIERAPLTAALADAYTEIGKPPPRLFIFDSPAACMLAIKIMGPDFCRVQLGGQLRVQLGGQLGGQRIWNPNFLWGSQDLYWIAWGKFAEKIGVKLKLDTSRRLDIMDRIGAQCEWWWPFENVVIASEKPRIVRWDDDRRLHCENGPAVEYADGYSLFAWHGRRLPARWVLERDTIDPTEILREQNVETKAAGLACIGMARMLSALDAKVIDRDPNPAHGELIEVRLEGLPKPGRYLKAECPRNGTICEGVPDTITTVIEAQAWRVGLHPSEFRYPEYRT